MTDTAEELSVLREEINRIDRDILRLFEERMDVSRRVAAYKLAHSMPVLDAAREAEVIASRGNLAQAGNKEYAECLFRCIMEQSRTEQEKLIEAQK
ncbi:MAG: chorismate mutase [Clostridia bacterium]|nr:chorismate mutase [Clostridia bacterium]